MTDLTSEAYSVLVETRNILAERSRWFPGEDVAVDEHGITHDPYSVDAVRFSLAGAVMAASKRTGYLLADPDPEEAVIQTLAAMILADGYKVPTDYDPVDQDDIVHCWNIAPDVRHTDVISLLDRVLQRSDGIERKQEQDRDEA